MKTLIAYYSLEGNTDYTAKRIAEITGADLLRLQPKKAYKDKGFGKFLSGGRAAMMGDKPELLPYEADLASYDLIVLGFPVWASRITPPLRTFMEENLEGLKSKTVSAFACQSGSGAEKAFDAMKKLLEIDAFAAEAVFIDPKAKETEETNKSIEEFAKAIQSL